MHTLNGSRTRFIFNGDFSGDVIVRHLVSNKELAIPAKDLIMFVAEYVRKCKIEKLEMMEPHQVLGLDE